MTPDQHFQKLIGQLLLIGEGPAVAFDRDRVQGIEPSHTPMTFGSEVHRFTDAYKAARGDKQKLRVCHEIKAAIIQAQYSPRNEFIHGTLEWKVAIARDKRSIYTVARVYRCSPEQARKAKLEVQARIRAALDSGDKSIRGVAQDFGVSKSYVHGLAA